MEVTARVKALVDRLVAESRALAEYNFAEPIDLPAGATDDDIAKLEAHLHRPLPPSLRALLTLANGTAGLFFSFDLLSIREMLPGSAAYARAEALRRTLADGAPLIPPQSVVIADKRGDQPDCIYLDPSGVNDAGEWRAVVFDHETDEVVCEDLIALLERSIERYAAMRETAKELGEELDV